MLGSEEVALEMVKCDQVKGYDNCPTRQAIGRSKHTADFGIINKQNRNNNLI
jgi:hypothetical protein